MTIELIERPKGRNDPEKVFAPAEDWDPGLSAEIMGTKEESAWS